jgi:Domain of unknown function (DUF4149)
VRGYHKRAGRFWPVNAGFALSLEKLDNKKRPRMKFFSDIRLLILATWLGAAIFFVAIAQVAFRVLPGSELAGSVVAPNLAILNSAGIAVSVILLLTSIVGAAKISKLWLWVERFLLLVLGGACAVQQFVLRNWMESIRSQIGKPLSEIAADDPLRGQFDAVHQYSEWTLLAAMIPALIVFFIISNRKFALAPPEKADVYDFSKEFKV